MMNFSKLLKNQAYSYIFFGILTTLVNFISFIIFTKLIPLDYRVAASIAWAVAVLFAFVTNKLYVFRSHGISVVAALKEFLSFMFFRVLSYFVDIGAIIMLVEWLGVHDAIAKIVASGIVAVLNYFASKYYIFCLKTKQSE